MISYLKGKVLEKTTSFIVLLPEGSGIGYKVFVTPESLDTPLGSELSLYTYLKSSDDGQTLFGLPDFKTLQFYELLLTVSGVGPKGALAILSSSKIDIIEQAIATGDPEIFTRMSGVGKKTAERIILELKNKVGVLTNSNAVGSSDIFDALVSLGYKNMEVRDVIQKVDATQTMEQQLKEALKLLAK